MRNAMTKKRASTKASAEITHASVRVGRLDTMADIRREMSRLYRAARRTSGSEPDAQTAAKLAYILQRIGTNIEMSEFEARIAALESKLSN